MITGASQADAGVLVVAADDGIMPQTKEHVFLSRTLGINQLIVAINKIDLVDYSEDKYNELKEEVSNLIKTVGFNPKVVPFIPLSAFEGDNIKEASENRSLSSRRAPSFSMTPPASTSWSTAVPACSIRPR